MSTLSLLLASGLLIIPMVISYHEHLQLEKEIIISIAARSSSSSLWAMCWM